MQNIKSEHHHRIQHNRISPDAKFHLKQTIMIFWGQILRRYEKSLLTKIMMNCLKYKSISM